MSFQFLGALVGLGCLVVLLWPDHRSRPALIERLQSRAIALFTNPLFSLFEAVAIILAGFTASLFATELRAWVAQLLGVVEVAAVQPEQQAPEQADALGQMGVEAFCWVLGTAALLHVCRTVAQQTVQHRIRKQADASASKLQDLVTTNASPDYLQELGVGCEKVWVVVRKADDQMKKAVALRYTLETIAKLAEVYDMHEKATFVANVMWFVDGSDAEPWDDKVAFRAEGVALPGVRGLVVLSAQYSATATEGPDPEALDFALDVPKNVGDQESGWNVLPGAPMAFSRGHFEHFHPVSKIVDWFSAFGNFPRSVPEAVGAYFSEHTEIAGFVSVPLYEPSVDFKKKDEQRKIVGVLNVHWSDAQILDLPEVAQKFTHTIYPLRVVLAQLMIELQELQGSPRPGQP